MIRIVLTLFLALPVLPACLHAQEFDWVYDPGMMAVDGDELVSRMMANNLPPDLEGSYKVSIHAYADCPAFENKRMKIAAERAAYSENFLNNYFTRAELSFESEVSPKTDCAGASAEPTRCKVHFVFSRIDNPMAAAPEIPTQEPPAPEPVAETPPAPDATSAPVDVALDELSTLKIGQSLVLDGLNFQPGKHRILNDAKPVVKQLLTIMRENPTLQIEIQGHVCCGKKGGKDGLDEETNKYDLSWGRAKFVYDYLIENGVDPARLTYKGYAMDRPLVYPEVTIQDQIKNRRVEVLITGK